MSQDEFCYKLKTEHSFCEVREIIADWANAQGKFGDRKKFFVEDVVLSYPDGALEARVDYGTEGFFLDQSKILRIVRDYIGCNEKDVVAEKVIPTKAICIERWFPSRPRRPMSEYERRCEELGNAATCMYATL